MEIAEGKSGQHLVSGIFPVGMIWMLFPLMGLAVACNDPPGVNITCPLNELPGVNCTYIKGLPLQLPEPGGSIDYPGPVKNVNVDTIVKKDDDKNKCGMYLNITWFINPLANPRYLRGFLLNVTFFYDGASRSIVRTYSVSVADWNNMDVYRTAFRHECIKPASGLAYQVRIHSLPLSTLSERNYVDYFLTTSESFDVSTPCDTPNNSYVTYNWRATMWSKQNPSEGTFNSLEICFFLAPEKFKFTTYKLSLMNFTTSEMLTTVDEKFIYSNGTKDRKACAKFSNLCPGIYKAWVLPVNDRPCVCRAGPNPDDCRDSCFATELSPIDMSNSRCSSSVGTTTPFVSYSDYPSSDAKIIGIVVGIVVAVAVILTVIIFFIRLRRRKGHADLEPMKLPSDEAELSVSQKSVLLVYSTDNESHRKVIRSFAAFLHARCGCDVLYDEWSKVDIVQTNPIDWLSKQMYRVKHIIIVNSLGAYRQYRGWIEQRLYVPDSNLLLPDVFVPAIRQIQSKVYLGSPDIRCFHVCFPYTDQQHVLDLSFGKCYKLMDHIEDLFLNIHGMTRFSAKGTTFANQINASSYHLNAKEGRALFDAIEEACDYARNHPDWFNKYYRLEEIQSEREKLIETGGTSSLCRQPDDDFFSDPFSTQNGSKTSDLDNASDINFASPSVESSYMEIDDSSPDFGIGEMNYDGAFEASSPPMFVDFAPLPPDDLDDNSSIGSRSFVAKVNELNRQFDSGFPSSLYEFNASRSDC